MKNWRVALPRVRKMPIKRRLCNPNVARTSSQARNPSLPPLAFARRISDCFIFVSIPNSVQKSPMTWECSAIALPRKTLNLFTPTMSRVVRTTGANNPFEFMLPAIGTVTRAVTVRWYGLRGANLTKSAMVHVPCLVVKFCSWESQGTKERALKIRNLHLADRTLIFEVPLCRRDEAKGIGILHRQMAHMLEYRHYFSNGEFRSTATVIQVNHGSYES